MPSPGPLSVLSADGWGQWPSGLGLKLSSFLSYPDRLISARASLGGAIIPNNLLFSGQSVIYTALHLVLLPGHEMNRLVCFRFSWMCN